MKWGERRCRIAAGFRDLDDRYAALSKAGDPLERVDFELFRPALDAAGDGEGAASIRGLEQNANAHTTWKVGVRSGRTHVCGDVRPSRANSRPQLPAEIIGETRDARL